MDRRVLLDTLARLDAWLETMRAPTGYGGPISHWWESNLLFTAPLFDWRYEGVIDGYRELFLRTGRHHFLGRALAAAEDLPSQLLPDGRLRNSSFQFGPVRGGTPHEAAIDVALLKLADTLFSLKHERAQTFQDLAVANLERYWMGTLWDGQGFRDQPYNPVLVANKHGTLLEALLEYEAQTGIDCGRYIEACVRVITSAQVADGAQRGGTVHRGIGPSRLAIPIYTARAANGLLSYYLRTGDETVRPVIERAATFLVALRSPAGTYWGIYGSGRLCRNPQMIAGAGDVLRLLVRLREQGMAEVEREADALVTTLLVQQQPGGGLPTAQGFTLKGLGRATSERDLRDVLPVVGWVDKSFRALALLVEADEVLPNVDLEPYEVPVRWRGRRFTFRESRGAFEVRDSAGTIRYHWRKGKPAPETYEL